MLDKNLAKKTDKILFVKIGNDGFDLGAQRRAIKGSDLPAALEIIRRYKQSVVGNKKFELNSDEEKLASLVKKAKIAESGDYNLSGDKYKEAIVYSGKWEFVELGDVCEIINGYAFKSKNYVKDGIRVIRITNVQKGVIVDENPKFYPLDTKEPIKQYKLNKDDLLISLTGNVGRVGLLPQHLLPSALNQRVACLRNNKEKINRRFLFYLLNQDVFEQSCIASSKGIAQKNLSTVWLSKFKIPLPPLEIQEQIVAELDNYQKIIDGARQVVENYRPHIDIDPEWEQEELGNICDIKTGKLNANAAVKDGKYPFFTCSKDVFRIDHYAFDCEAILLSGNNATGKFNVKHYKGKFNAYQRTYVITIKSEFKKKLLYGLLKYVLTDNLALLRQKSIGGLTKYLTLNMITSLKVPLPNIGVQQKLVDQFEKEQSLVNANEEAIRVFEQKIKERIARVWGT